MGQPGSQIAGLTIVNSSTAGGVDILLDRSLSSGCSQFGGGVATVVLHELGHLVGLDHATDPGEIMLPDGIRLPPGEGDKDGVSALYPEATGTITGIVRSAATGAPIAGAAVSPAGPTGATTLPSGLTALPSAVTGADGRFALAGLARGVDWPFRVDAGGGWEVLTSTVSLGDADLDLVFEPRGPTTVSIDDVKVLEGDSGTTIANVTLRLAGEVFAGPHRAQGSFVLGTAGSDDFVVYGAFGVEFAPGQTTATVPVEIVGDSIPEADETFSLVIDFAIGLTVADGTGLVTILDDDTPRVASVGAASVKEGQSGRSIVNVPVTLSPAAFRPVTVKWATSDLTALAGSDYAAASGVVSFAAGESSKTVPVTVYGDTAIEPTETFRLTLSDPSQATLGQSQATITIVNDDDTTPPVIAAKADVSSQSKLAPVAVLYTPPAAKDAVDGAVETICKPPSGSSLPVRDHQDHLFGPGPLGERRHLDVQRDRVRALDAWCRLRAGTGPCSPSSLRRTTSTSAPAASTRRARSSCAGSPPTAPSSTSERPRSATTGDFDEKVVMPKRTPLGPGQMTAIGTTPNGTELVRAWLLVVA